MAPTDASGRTYTAPDGTRKPDRRHQGIPTMELWKKNIEGLQEAGVRGCLFRYSLDPEGNITFVIRVEDEPPVGRLKFNFPLVEKPLIQAAGWKRFNLTLEIFEGGLLTVTVKGRFERDNVPLEVNLEFERVHGMGIGIARDYISFIDRRNGDRGESSMKDVLDAKLRDGTRKFCRSGDTVRDLPVEGIVAILGRFLKDAALRRRVVRKK